MILSSKKWLTQFYNYIIKNEIILPSLTIFGNSKNVDSIVAKYLRRIGVTDVILGFETADPEIFKDINKGSTNIDDNVNASKTLLEHNISVTGSYVFGLPNTTKHTIDKCFDQVSQISNSANPIDGNARFSGYANVIIPFPGSDIFTQMCKANRRLFKKDQLDQHELQIEYFKTYFGFQNKDAEKYLDYLSSKRDELNSYTNSTMIKSVGLKTKNC